MSTLDEVEESDLPNPELYIIVNGKTTKNNVVWRNLLPINDIKAASLTAEFTYQGRLQAS